MASTAILSDLHSVGDEDVQQHSALATVDIDLIEQHKENIQPLASGRSALQLAALSSQTRAGLGEKLSEEHTRFQTALAALDLFEHNKSVWDEGHLGLSGEQVAAMADDPLDIHHQYARFVLNSYPAGASSSSRLLPLLESSTRKFLDDERYTNDPRYLRLWNLYAKNMDCPEDCYRFLFAKGIGERLAILYEEYALVLESAGKRTQADQIYTLGQNRFAAPLDRLKKRHQAFQARMLLAPPLAEPESIRQLLASTTSRDARSILGGASLPPPPATTIASSGPVNGAKGFAVFQDTADEPSNVTGVVEGEWKDLGTIKSRRRENEIEAVEWRGETMPMNAKKSGGIGKLEVFRDNNVESSTTAVAGTAVDTAEAPFGRSLRGPSEAELLRQNPFKNYSSADLSLSSLDPLIAAAKDLKKSAASKSSGERKSSSGAVKKSSSSSSTAKASSLSKSASATASKEKPTGPVTERVACPLALIYPSPGVEVSLEELKMKSRIEYTADVEVWKGWKWRKVWEEEMRTTGRSTHVVDPVTGWPLLYDTVTLDPLYNFLPQPVKVVADPTPSPAKFIEALSPLRLHSESSSSSSSSTPIQHAVISAQSPFLVDIDSPLAAPVLEAQPVRVQQRRPPSPTMNTKQAQFMMDSLFSKTINFDDLDEEEEDQQEESEEDDEEAEEEGESQDSQSQSQPQPHEDQLHRQQVHSFTIPTDFHFSQPDLTANDSSASIVNSSQRSEEEVSEEMNRRIASAGTTGMISVPALLELGIGDNQGHVEGEPLRLFKDLVHSQQEENGNENERATLYKPIMNVSRTPFGTKSSGGLGGAGGRLFQVMRDDGDENVGRLPQHAPSALFQVSLDPVDEPSTPLQLQVQLSPLRLHQEEEFELDARDGFAMGRRPTGALNRFAPMIDIMTPMTERTCEFTNSNTVSSLSQSQRSRRDSMFPVTETVEEEPEDEEDEDDDDDSDEDGSSEEEASEGEAGDRAFVGVEDDDGEESDRSSYRNRGGSTEEETEEEDEDEEIVNAHGQSRHFQQSVAAIPTRIEYSSTIERSTTDGSIMSDNHLQLDHQRASSQERSFELSQEVSVGEGYTIEGNQSGMVTSLVLAEPTATSSQLAQSGDLAEIDNPCNPFDPALIFQLLARVSPPVLDHPLAHDLSTRSANRLDTLQMVAKKRADKALSSAGASSKANKDKTGIIEDAWELELAGETFSVREKLGEGAFGAVFRVAVNPEDMRDEDDSDYDESLEELSMAVKVERPTNLWEFYILQQLHSQLPPRIKSSVIAASRLYAYKDESFLFLDFCDQGTLLDAVNKANEAGISPSTGGASNGLEEIVAIFFVIELLRVVEAFHACGFIHGDLKIDNCLVRLENIPGKDWATKYDASGAGGWSKKGIKVIDFGRSVDTKAFAPGMAFKSIFKADEFDCVEMQAGQSWTYETDYFGIASIAFSLLFGRFMEITSTVTEEGVKEYRINQNFKRYQQSELWTPLFHALLNPRLHIDKEEGQCLPIINELAEIRESMESWLTKNCDKNGKSLKGLIKKMEIYSLTKYGR